MWQSGWYLRSRKLSKWVISPMTHGPRTVWTDEILQMKLRCVVGFYTKRNWNSPGTSRIHPAGSVSASVQLGCGHSYAISTFPGSTTHLFIYMNNVNLYEASNKLLEFLSAFLSSVAGHFPRPPSMWVGSFQMSGIGASSWNGWSPLRCYLEFLGHLGTSLGTSCQSTDGRFFFALIYALDSCWCNPGSCLHQILNAELMVPK